jgi:HTH-type transcriptional regulator, competence development regulator
MLYTSLYSENKGTVVTSELGEQLKSVRIVKGMSLREVARLAEISVAYLQKLEHGDVDQPSPRVLFRLGKAVNLPYELLMQLAGYEATSPSEQGALLGARASSASFSRAIDSTDLTDEERKAVAAFISHLRDQREKN